MGVYANQMHPRANDATLVQRTRSGDEEAFAAIFKRHHAPLLSYCRHMLSSQDEAEDALQQAFIKAHQALLGGTAPRELRPWLYAIARNCCLTAIAARRPTTQLEDRMPTLQGLSEEVHRREDLRELVAGIGRLPEDQRSALLLAELDDLPHQAIATIVGCEVSKVKALIYQARSALIADRDAQNTPCEEIREQLSVAHGGELRRGPLRRHLKLCVGCRDFQLALGAQRQSLAAVLPVAPSAGLAAAILGHGAMHAHLATAAGIGHASGVGAASGTGLGSGAAGAMASGGTSLAASGTAASAGTTAAGASAGGTSVGALLGGGLVTKLAVGGAVVALATAGAAAVHNHEAHASPRHPARLLADLRPGVSANASRPGIAATDIADSSSLDSGSSSSLALGSPADSVDSPSSASLIEPSGLGSADPLLTTSGSLAPSPPASGSPSQPAVSSIKHDQSGAGSAPGNNSAARAKYRATLLRRKALLRRRSLLRRRALLRRRRAARRRARHKALQHRRHLVKPSTPKPVVTPTPKPVEIRHRKAHPTPTPSTTIQPTGTTTTGDEEGKGVKGRRHPPTGTGSTEASSTGTGSTGSGSTGSGTGKASSKTGAGETEGSGSGKTEGTDGSTPSKTKTGNGETNDTGKGSANGTSDAGESAGTSAKTGTGATYSTSTRTGTKAHPKNHLVEEEQLPNL
jgi:RNA polymerase sigma factor (sigma-70 family)